MVGQVVPAVIEASPVATAVVTVTVEGAWAETPVEGPVWSWTPVDVLTVMSLDQPRPPRIYTMVLVDTAAATTPEVV